MQDLYFCSHSSLCLLHSPHHVSPLFPDSLFFAFVEKRNRLGQPGPRSQFKAARLRGWRKSARVWKVVAPFFCLSCSLPHRTQLFLSGVTFLFSGSERKGIFKVLRPKHISVQLNSCSTHCPQNFPKNAKSSFFQLNKRQRK